MLSITVDDSHSTLTACRSGATVERLALFFLFQIDFELYRGKEEYKMKTENANEHR